MKNRHTKIAMIIAVLGIVILIIGLTVNKATLENLISKLRASAWHIGHSTEVVTHKSTPNKSSTNSNPTSAQGNSNPTNPFTLSDQDRLNRLAQLKSAITGQLSDTSFVSNNTVPWDQYISSTDSASTSTRDLADAAFAELALGLNSNYANGMLSREFAAQNLTTGSHYYGTLPWALNSSTLDYNADNFSNLAIGPIIEHYSDKLSPTLVNHIKTVSIPAAYQALQLQINQTANNSPTPNMQKVTPSYTNQWLMKSTCMILEGEAIGNTTEVNQGNTMLDKFVQNTRSGGIGEFDSPTYYGTDLESLYMGSVYAQTATERQKYNALLEYFWTDISANDFYPNGDLSGAHSRDYDFLTGTGYAYTYMYIEGYRQDLASSISPLTQNIFTYIGMGGGTPLSGITYYHPDKTIRSLAMSSERTVWQAWSLTSSKHSKITYTNNDFSLGTTTTGNVNAQDKMFDLDLKSSNPKTPQITFVPDEYDNPYGFITNSGKQHHLPLNPLFVQSGGTALALLDIKPSQVLDRGDIPSITTNIILPTNVDSLIYNNSKVTINQSTNVPLSGTNTTFGIRLGSSGAAFRIFHVDSCQSGTPSLSLKTDTNSSAGIPSGYSQGAMRLRIFDGCAETSTDIPIGILVVVQHTADDASLQKLINTVSSTTIIDSLENSDWSVSVPNIYNVNLAAERNINSGKIIKQTVNNAALPTDIFTVTTATGTIDYSQILNNYPT